MEGGNPKTGQIPSGNLSINQTLENHTGEVMVLAWNEKYQKLTSSDQYGLIIVWMLHKCMWFEEMINNRKKSFVRDMKWTADGLKICIAYEDGYSIVGSVDGNRLWGKELDLQLAKVEWSPDSHIILFGTTQGQIHVYDSDGNFIQRLAIACAEGRSFANIISISWYAGLKGLLDPDVPTLSIVMDNGRAQFMRSETDQRPIIIDTGMTVSSVAWSDNGSVLAVSGAFKGNSQGSSASGVNFYSPYGQHLRTMRVPGPGVNALAWEGEGLRLVLAVDSFMYFANVRPDYRWGYFGNTLVYSFLSSERPEHGVMFWNPTTGSKTIKYVKRLVGIATGDEYCVLATRAEDSREHILIVCNNIGVPCDSRYITVEPKLLAMTRQHIFAVSDTTIYSWEYNPKAVNYVGDFSRETDGLNREHVLSVNNVVLSNQDTITAICADSRSLVVACDSGLVIRYSIPSMAIQSKILVAPHPRTVRLNCDSTTLAVISDSGALALYRLHEDVIGFDPMPGDKLEFDRKDCWSIMWSEDIPDLFAVLEKARMYIFRGLQPEEPKPSSAYLCKFDSLQVRSALLDKIMDNPENPEIEHIEDHNTKSMRDTEALLETASMEDVFQFIEDNSHPKLWRQLAEFSLRKLNFQVADKAFVRCGNYHGVQFVKRLQQLDSTDKQRAEVAAFFHNFDAAEEIYRGMDRLDLAVEMRMKLGDWFKVEKILEAGGGDDAAMAKTWNNIGEYYSNRQKWSKAVQYYTKAKNSEQLVRCFYALEDYQGLQTLLTVIPEGSPSLVNLGEKFMSVGLCTQAVGAFLKAGEVKRAVNCCVFLHQWDQAIALAEEHEFTQINVLLEKYAAHLLEKGKRLQAVELLQKSGKHGEAAKMLVGLAQQALAEGLQPLRAKKLYVLAAFQIEEMRKQTLQLGMQDAAGTKRTTQAATQATLAGLLELDAASADVKDLDNAWRGAEAVHLWMLAHRQFHSKQYDAALKTALNLLKYGDILQVEQMYAFFALVSLYTKFYGQLSKAMMKLESLAAGSAQAGLYEDITFQVFAKNHPTDRRGLREARARKKGEVQQVCMASGALIADASWVTCRTCKHCISNGQAAALSLCPLCHSNLRRG